MEGIEFNPGNPAEYNDFIPEVEKTRLKVLFWTATIVLSGFGLYYLFKSYIYSNELPNKPDEY